MTATATKPAASSSSSYTPQNALERYFAAVLKLIKAPVTQKNIAWLVAWAGTENTTAGNNPLATTQPAAGATVFNSVGVKNYPSAASGVVATAQTLQNGYYPAIVAALQSGDPVIYTESGPGGSNATSIIAQLKKWGSHGFAADVQANDLPQSYVTATGGGSSGTGPNPYGTSPTSTATAAGGAVLSYTTQWVDDLAAWLTKEGKLVLAYIVLVGVAGAIFYKGLTGLGIPTPKLPKTVPVPA